MKARSREIFNFLLEKLKHSFILIQKKMIQIQKRFRRDHIDAGG